jgi:hypothetical protein
MRTIRSPPSTAKLITLNGTIARFVWMNPHTRIYLDVTDASGAVAKWECEGSAPGGPSAGLVTI